MKVLYLLIIVMLRHISKSQYVYEIVKLHIEDNLMLKYSKPNHV